MGVCIYVKESFTVQLININFLNKCLLCDVIFDNKKGYITVSYRSPSQSSSKFDNFLSGFQNMFTVITSLKPDCSIILGDIYTREGTNIDAHTSYYDLNQSISQLIHILAHSPSCVDLIFRSRVVDLSFIVTHVHQKLKALFCCINFDYTKNFIKKMFYLSFYFFFFEIKKEKKNTH